MSLTDNLRTDGGGKADLTYVRKPGDDWITERDYRWSGGDYAESHRYSPARHLRLSTADGQVTGDGSDIEVVTVEVVSGLQVCRDNTPADVLAYDGDCTVVVAGQERTVTLVDGTGRLEISTDQPTGETVTVEARDLADHPAKPDAVSIEVV